MLSSVKKMGKDEEGFVVNDASGNRLKFKSPEYLVAAHVKGNGKASKKKIIELLQEEKLDDFLAYCPEQSQLARSVIQDLENKAEELEAAWRQCEPFANEPKPKFAASIGKTPYAPYLFSRYDGKTSSARDFLLSMHTPNLLRTLGYKEERDNKITDRAEEIR